MPIYYDIQPDLDLLLYIFKGEFSGDDYFKMYHSVYQNDLRHHGMKVIMDVRRAELQVGSEDLKTALDIVRTNREQGFEPDRVAVVTSSSTMPHLMNALVVLADDIPMHLSVFYERHDAIKWLGLAANEAAVMNFWDAMPGTM